METEVGKFRGYTILYDNRDRLFHLRDADGQDVGSGKTQEDAEEHAKKLVKLAYKFPIEALSVSGSYVFKGKVTSLNPDDYSVRFAYAEHRAATKEHLRRGSHIYEATEANKEIASQVDMARGHIKEIEEKIRSLISQLERPMNLKYFKLPER